MRDMHQRVDGALRAGNMRGVWAGASPGKITEEKTSAGSSAGRYPLGRETKGPLGMLVEVGG